jgi:hypothetical protein
MISEVREFVKGLWKRKSCDCVCGVVECLIRAPAVAVFASEFRVTAYPLERRVGASWT